MDSFTFFIIEGVMLLIVGAVAFLVVRYFKSHPSVEEWVLKAVNAAEVLFNVPKSGPEKKKWVLDFLINKIKVPATAEELSILIDAAVTQVNTIIEEEKTKE